MKECTTYIDISTYRKSEFDQFLEKSSFLKILGSRCDVCGGEVKKIGLFRKDHFQIHDIGNFWSSLKFL